MSPAHFSASHTFHCKTLIGMHAHLRTRSARLLSCLPFVSLPRSSAPLSPFVLTLPVQRVFTAGIHFNASTEPQMTRNPHLHCMLLHANVCAKLYLNVVLYRLHPQGSRERKIQKSAACGPCSILAKWNKRNTHRGIHCTDKRQKKKHRHAGVTLSRLFSSPNRGGAL